MPFSSINCAMLVLRLPWLVFLKVSPKTPGNELSKSNSLGDVLMNGFVALTVSINGLVFFSYLFFATYVLYSFLSGNHFILLIGPGM